MSTITCLGQNWNNAVQPAPPATAAPPAPTSSYNSNFWVSQNAAVTDNGELQLSVQANSGQYWNGMECWAAGQAVLEVPSGQMLAYGTYLVTFYPVGGWSDFSGGDTQPGQNTSTTFGVFIFDPAASFPYNEIDIVEVGYQNQNSANAWINQGGVANSNAQFCVQPWDGSTSGTPDWNQVNRVAINGDANGKVTFVANWQQDSVTFYAAPGDYSSDNFPYTGSDTITWTASSSNISIPAPTQTMSLFINCWPYGGPSTGNPVFFNVSRVEVPMSATS
ncbi:MAG: hypothetical protein MUC87_14785 [Bacteroidia bacterium]|jgi:hypothetical protein|nr:hypothetical protein [Bacteroidia bacterium]